MLNDLISSRTSDKTSNPLKDERTSQEVSSSQTAFKSLLMALKAQGGMIKASESTGNHGGNNGSKNTKSVSPKGDGKNVLGGRFSKKGEKSSEKDDSVIGVSGALKNSVTSEMATKTSDTSGQVHSKANSDQKEAGKEAKAAQKGNAKKSAEQNQADALKETDGKISPKKAGSKEKAKPSANDNTSLSANTNGKKKAASKTSGKTKVKKSNLTIDGGKASEKRAEKSKQNPVKEKQTKGTTKASGKHSNVNGEKGSKIDAPAKKSSQQSAKKDGVPKMNVSGEKNAAKKPEGKTQKSSVQQKVLNNKQPKGKDVQSAQKIPGEQAKQYSQKKKSPVFRITNASSSGDERKSVKLDLANKQKGIASRVTRLVGSQSNSSKDLSAIGWQVEKQRAKKEEKTSDKKAPKSTVQGSNNDMRSMRDGLLQRPVDKNDKAPVLSQSFKGLSFSKNDGNREQEITWKSFAEESKAVDKQEKGHSSTSFSSFKLNQMPIANGSLRKNMLSGLKKSVMKAASKARKSPQQWQKHSFSLDDGKKVQLSVREVKGLLQVKMGSAHSDLNKIIQQNLQQIRNHLKQHFESEIDLQYDGSGRESEFSGESSGDNDNRRRRSAEVMSNGVESGNAVEAQGVSVRNFGYNRMEWTA